MRRTSVALLMTMTAGCDIISPPAPPPPKPRPSPVALRPIAPEIPINARAAEALSREFGLDGCGDVTRLREVRENGVRAESWRIRSGKTCFDQWSARQQRYAILANLDVSQSKRDAMPWLCGTGRSEHDSACSTQRRKPTLVVEQPFAADFLIFRRISKDQR